MALNFVNVGRRETLAAGSLGLGVFSAAIPPIDNFLNAAIIHPNLIKRVGGLWVGMDTNAGPVLRYSSNGINWSSTPSPNSETVIGLAHNGTIFLAITSVGKAYTSPDLITWTNRAGFPGTINIAGNASPGDITDIAEYFSAVGLFVVGGGDNVGGIGVSSNRQAYSSADGITWQTNVIGSLSGPGNPAYGGLQNLKVVNGALIAVGYTYNPAAPGYGGSAYSTVDGINWSVRTIFVGGAFLGQNGTTGGNKIAYSSTLGLYVAVILLNRTPGGNAVVYSSPDLITWTLRFPGTGSVDQGGLSWDGNQFVFFAGQTPYYSRDGITWLSLSNTINPGFNRCSASFGNA